MLPTPPWRIPADIRSTAVNYHGASPPIFTPPEKNTYMTHSLEIPAFIKSIRFPNVYGLGHALTQAPKRWPILDQTDTIYRLFNQLAK
jgi:hypothetical protein